jgi:hypothetical protein
MNMSFETNSKSFSTNLYASKDNKKDILWNAIEPGDPYDIRRYFRILLILDQQLLGYQEKRKDLWVRICK